MDKVQAVKITNGKEVFTQFNRITWDLLGADKNGYVEVIPQNIVNSVASAKSVAAGEGQVISNDEQKKADLENKVVKEKPKVIQNGIEQKKAEFLKHVDGFNKGTIKDYFDKQEPPISYDNTAKIDALKMQLGEHFNFDTDKLQKAFNF